MDVGADNFRFDLDDPEKKARTIRWPKTAELHLDSLDRYNVSTVPILNGVYGTGLQQDQAQWIGRFYANSAINATDNCIIQSKRNLIYGYMSRVALTQFSINYNVPTILAGYNDIFTVQATVGGASYSGTLTAGYYDVTTLASALQTALRAVGGGSIFPALTVVPPTNQSQAITGATVITRGFTINTNTAATIFFTTSASTAVEGDSIGRFLRLIGANRASFGFTPEYVTSPVLDPTPNSPATTFQMGPPNLRPTDYIDIVSNGLTNYKDTKDSNSSIQAPMNVIGRIWLTEANVNSASTGQSFADPNLVGTAPLAFVKTWAYPNWSQWSPNTAINSIDITLLDMWGNPVFWSPTYPTEWSATLTVTE